MRTKINFKVCNLRMINKRSPSLTDLRQWRLDCEFPFLYPSRSVWRRLTKLTELQNRTGKTKIIIVSIILSMFMILITVLTSNDNLSAFCLWVEFFTSLTKSLSSNSLICIYAHNFSKCPAKVNRGIYDVGRTRITITSIRYYELPLVVFTGVRGGNTLQKYPSKALYVKFPSNELVLFANLPATTISEPLNKLLNTDFVTVPFVT